MVYPVILYGCESWTIKKVEHQKIDVLNCGVGEDCWEISKTIKPVPPKGNQLWIFIGGTDAEAEAPIIWPPDVKNWLTGKDPDAGKDWRQEEKGKTDEEMVGWHHQLNGLEFEQAPRVGDGQGSLVCCIPWGRRVRQDWATELMLSITNFNLTMLDILDNSVFWPSLRSMSYQRNVVHFFCFSLTCIHTLPKVYN